MEPRQRWLTTIIFAAAMAWVESAVVVYLRALIGRLEPYQSSPLPIVSGLGEIEIVREAATLIMLLCVGWLAGQTWRSRIAYVMVAFGLWDMLYYLFLIPMSGWPHSLLDWDILFLLPLPWWGPVLAPVLIALLLLILGTLISQFDQVDQPLWPSRGTWGFGLGGCILALYTFMSDSLATAGRGAQALRDLLPGTFNWSLYALALALMTGLLIDVMLQLWARKTLRARSGLEYD